MKLIQLDKYNKSNIKSMNGFKCFPSKGVSTTFYRLQYYEGMCFDKMCEGGSRRLVQCGGNDGLRPGWAQGNTGQKSVLVKKPVSRKFIVLSSLDILFFLLAAYCIHFYY